MFNFFRCRQLCSEDRLLPYCCCLFLCMGRRLAPNPEHLAFGEIFFSRLSRKGNELSFSCYGISWERAPSIGLCSRGGFEGCSPHEWRLYPVRSDSCRPAVFWEALCRRNQLLCTYGTFVFASSALIIMQGCVLSIPVGGAVH